MLSAIVYHARSLALFAALSAGFIAITYALTKAPIEQARQAAANKSLQELLPADVYDNNLQATRLTLSDADSHALGFNQAQTLHIALKANQPVAWLLPGRAPDGYSGPIDFLMAVDRDGQLLGVRVISHKETPGLGDKIELRKSPWILQFAGKSLAAPQAAGWRVKKDGGEFDQFTGATITPRALIGQIKRNLEQVVKRQETWQQAYALQVQGEALSSGEMSSGETLPSSETLPPKMPLSALPSTEDPPTEDQTP